MSGEPISETRRRAEEFLLAGRLRDARALFDAAATGCYHPGFELALARLEVLENRLQAAVPRLQRLLAAQPGLAPARELLADACYRAGDLATAARAYRALGRHALADHLARLDGAHPCSLDSTGEPLHIAWLRREPLPVVRARIGPADLNLVLDTGAGDLMLDGDTAAELQLPLAGEEDARFAGGRGRAVRYGIVERLELGGRAVTHVPMQSMPLRETFAPWFPDCPIHGVLGSGLFARIPTVLDFRTGHLTLDDPAAAAAAGTPLYLAGTHHPLIEAQLDRDQRLLLFIDTGLTGAAVALAPSALRQTRALESGAARLGQGGGGAVPGQPVRLPRLALDGLVYRNVDALVLAPFPIERRFGTRIGGLLGHDFFRGRRLVLDFARGRVGID